MKPQSCSMHLFREGETKTAELGRKRYEELKKDLEARGLKDRSVFLDEDNTILVVFEYSYFTTFHSTKWDSKSHGPLSAYNPPLLLAIAGQRPEGGKGCRYVRNHDSRMYLCEKVTEHKNSLNGHEYQLVNVRSNGFQFVSEVELLKDYHLATIEELIEAFPPTENAQVEPEPRKIRKGDRLLCVDACPGELTQGNFYIALTDQQDHNLTEDIVTVTKDNGYKGSYRISRFTIANEEGPVKEEREWGETIELSYQGVRIHIERSGMYFGDGSVIVTGFLRYALQRYDQIKRQ